MNKNHYMILIATAILVGGLSFYGGVQYANAAKGNSSQAQGATGQGQRAARQASRPFGNGQAGGSFANGDILAVDAQSVTVKLANGGSKIAFYSASTKITKTVDGTVDDLKVGESLMINGQDNPDGSMTSQTIQLRNRPVVDPNAKTAPQTTTPGATK